MAHAVIARPDVRWSPFPGLTGDYDIVLGDLDLAVAVRGPGAPQASA